MDENYGQSPNSITAGRTRKRKDFPADAGGDTMVERAIQTAEEMRGVSTKPKDEDKDTPRTSTAKRTQFAKPPKPDTSAGGGKLGKVSPEEQRGQSISQALLKGAAMVPESRYSGTLRGLLGGASVGLDIGTALDKYRRTKLDETAATAAMKMSPEASADSSNPSVLGGYFGRDAGSQVKRAYRRRDELAGGEYNPQMNA